MGNYGHPDLFITFTCKQSWEETANEFMPGRKGMVRYNLTARVFRQKLIKLSSVIIKGQNYVLSNSEKQLHGCSLLNPKPWTASGSYVSVAYRYTAS